MEQREALTRSMAALAEKENSAGRKAAEAAEAVEWAMTAANARIRVVPRARKPGSRSEAGEEFLQRVGKLNVDRSGGQRKPHKPLLLLLAIARLMRRGEGALEFVDVERSLRPLLELYAPPVVGRPQPELPYWHLQSDKVWQVPGATQLERTAKGFPALAALRASSGSIPERYAGPLLADERLAKQAVQLLLDEHFEPSLHADVLAGVGLEAEWLASGVPVSQASRAREPSRDPTFRDAVLERSRGPTSRSTCCGHCTRGRCDLR